jgi:hypothetical protein
VRQDQPVDPLLIYQGRHVANRHVTTPSRVIDKADVGADTASDGCHQRSHSSCRYPDT